MVRDSLSWRISYDSQTDIIWVNWRYNSGYMAKPSTFVCGWLFFHCNNASWQYILSHWKDCLFPLTCFMFRRNFPCGLPPWKVCRVSLFFPRYYSLVLSFWLVPLGADNQISSPSFLFPAFALTKTLSKCLAHSFMRSLNLFWFTVTKLVHHLKLHWMLLADI